MGGSPQALSQQDYQDLQEIASKLPQGHPMAPKISTLLNSQPTQFEQQRSGGGTTSGPPGSYKEPSMTGGAGTAAWNTLKSMFNLGPGLSDEEYARQANERRNTPQPLVPGLEEAEKGYHEARSAGTGQSEAIGSGIATATGLTDPAKMREHAARGESGAIVGEASVPIGAAIVGAGLHAAGAKVPTIRAAIGGSKALENVPTRSIGDVIESPSKAPAYALRKVFPEPIDTPNIGEATGGARKGAATAKELEGKMTDVEAARQKELGDQGRLREEENKQHEQHAQSVSEAEKARQKELSDAERLKLQHGESLMKRGGEQGKIDAAAAKQTIGPKIVAPSVGEPRMGGSEGRAATWTNEDVMRLAQQGNREAIQQVVRRGMQLPPGARYVMGDPDFSRAVYNPREVTHFSPSGEPIRNVQNPTERAPRERIFTPQAEPPAREVTNAQTGEVTRPGERRTGSSYERDIFQKMITNPEGEQLGKMIRGARSEAPSGITEGAARNYLMQQPGGWKKFLAADEAGRRAMLIEARNALKNGKQ